MVTKVGFFRELRHGDADGPSLGELVAAGPVAVDPRMLGYLEHGPVMATTGRLVDDVLDPARTGVAPLDVRTDGVWAWPGDLAYYVRTYGVPLPDDLVGHARAADWEPPELGVDDLMAVSEQLRG
jgi:hypothetical protein